MRRTARAIILAAAVSALMSAPVLAGPGGAAAVPLNTGQEVIIVNSGASGSFEYSIDGSQLCYEMSVRNLSMAPFAAHIHPGPRQVAGPVAVPLLTPPSATSMVSDCITASADSPILTTAELAAIAANPGAFYVNVHTLNYQPGEIRGQLK
jgi:hypothetical protein